MTIDELQDLISGIKMGRTTVSKSLQLLKQLYNFALSREYCSKNPAQHVQMPDTPAYVHHQEFTDEELRILWEHQNDPIVRTVLIMCYSGYRISAYKTVETNFEKGYFRGGVKNESSKNRIVPIHSGIRELVERAVMQEDPYLMNMSIDKFCKKMAAKMVEIGIDGDGRHHTPHSCRHSFSRLCESYGVREADRKRMLGHSFGSDLTNGVYGHRTLEELREQIEKIKVPR